MSINQVKSLVEDENGLEDLNNNSLKLLDGIKNFGLDNINTAIDILDRSKAELDELKRLLNSEISFVNNSKYNLDDLEDRLYELRSQARKHNCTVDELITIKGQLEKKLNNANNSKQKLQELRKQFEHAKQHFITISNQLSISRKK